MLTVACVLWQGRFRRRRKMYGTDWVLRLKNMVKRNLPVPHRFVCLSNVDVPCERIPLIHDWPGWFSKIELHRPGLFKDRVLYIDLDELILKNLMPFFEFPSPFATTGGRGYKGWFKEDLIKIRKYGSAVMVFDPGAGEKLYTEFNERVIKVFWGDQDYLAFKMPNLDTFPTSWTDRIEKGDNGKVPNKETIIMHCMCPGKNRGAIHEYKWAEEIWV